MTDSTVNQRLAGNLPDVAEAEIRSLKRTPVGYTFLAALAATTAELHLPQLPPGPWKVARAFLCIPANKTGTWNGSNLFTWVVNRRDSADFTTADAMVTYVDQAVAAGDATKIDISSGIDWTDNEFDGSNDLVTFVATRTGTLATYPAGTSIQIELERVG